MRLRIACLLLLSSWPVGAAELKPATVAAFDRYVRVTEARIAAEVTDERRFIGADLEGDRDALLARVREGQFLIERRESRDNGARIDVPDGLIHHWLGAVFVPGATLDSAVALLQDYDRHQQIYAPAVAGSKVLHRDGDHFRLFLRFFMKKVIAVTVNSEHDARFTRASPSRAYSRLASTRIAEVEDAGTPTERELPVGNDGGYLWRLNSYWRFFERDGGTYIQCETVSLTRAIPTGLGWLVGPFVTSLPRESLTFTLETTKKALAGHR